MNSNNNDMQATNIQNYLFAMLLHDLSKLVLTEKGWWEMHPFLEDDIAVSIGNDLRSIIESHHKIEDQNNIFQLAVSLADKIQKAMHGSVDDEGNSLEKTFEKHKDNPPFYPYYGEKIERYNKPFACKIAKNIYNQIKGLIKKNGKLTLKSLLDIQRQLLHYPHTSPNIPHLSLALHHQFSSALFYMALNKLKDLRRKNIAFCELNPFTFYLVVLTPDYLALYYRLKDIKIHREMVKKLRGYIFENIFKKLSSDLPDIDTDSNPFEFYNKDNLIIVWDNPEDIHNCLKKYLQSALDIKSVVIEETEYSINIFWKNGRPSYASPDIKTKNKGSTYFSSDSLKFYNSSLSHCMRCNKPISSKYELCTSCSNITKGIGGVINLHALPEDERRISYIFLNVKSPLRNHSVDVARRLINNMTKAKNIEAPQINPTNTGLLEFLQTTLEIESFQKDVSIKFPKVSPIVEFPQLMCYVMDETIYWRFLSHINGLRSRLQLETSLVGVMCPKVYPVWSLMDKCTDFNSYGDIYYDISERSVTMFTTEEVNAIRVLAESATSERVPKYQLNILSQFALIASLEELLLEIDVRAKERKLGRYKFHSELKKYLSKLTVDNEYKQKDKRAIFIKYVLKLLNEERR